MRKSREPWLDWRGSLAEAEQARRIREAKARIKTRRKHFWAFFLLLTYGVVGFHRFYLYDSKFAWRLICLVLCLSLLLSLFGLIFPIHESFISSAFLGYLLWIAFITLEVPYIFRRVAEINEEVENYD